MIPKNLLLGSFVFFAISCDRATKEEVLRLKTQTQSFENSSKTINAQTAHLFAAFEDRKSDPKTKAVAERQVLHFENLDRRSQTINKYIDSLIASARENEVKPVSLFNHEYVLSNVYKRLDEFQNSILAMDESLKKDFYNHDIIFRAGDSVASPELFYKIYFSENSSEEILLSLATIKNNINIFENSVASWLLNQTTVIGCDWSSQAGVIISQNSTIVKPGEKVVITAGIGSFSSAAAPEIFIAGKKVQLENSVAIKTISASQLPGDHSVPVKVEFVDQDGKKITKEFLVSYTVFSPQ